MGTSKREQLPPDLERGRSRFQAWRGQRKPGRRIPQALWAMAARLAKVHAVSRATAVLGLDYYRLKELATVAASEPHPSGPAFLELTPPVLVAKQASSIAYLSDNRLGLGVGISPWPPNRRPNHWSKWIGNITCSGRPAELWTSVIG